MDKPDDNFLENDEKNRQYHLQGEQVLSTPNLVLWRIDFYFQVKKSSSSPYSKKSHNVKIYFSKNKSDIGNRFYFLFCVLISITIKYVGVLQALYKNKMLFLQQKILDTKNAVPV